MNSRYNDPEFDISAYFAAHEVGFDDMLLVRTLCHTPVRTALLILLSDFPMIVTIRVPVAEIY